MDVLKRAAYPYNTINSKVLLVENFGYRFHFNGKETDNETQAQDYGMRIYDYRLSKFLSSDPLARNYPELTTYQFASNTPIRAIDLDGLEAAVINYGYRVTAMIVTGSFNVGAVIDAQGNVKVFTQWSAGPAIGAYAGGGLSFSFYPTASADQVMGHGVNFGGNVGIPGISVGLDINASIQTTNNKIKGVKMGISPALRPGSLGPGGVEIHLDYSHSDEFENLSFNIMDVKDDMKEQLQEKLNMSRDEIEKYLNYLKVSSVKLQSLKSESEKKTETSKDKKMLSNNKPSQEKQVKGKAPKTSKGKSNKVPETT